MKQLTLILILIGGTANSQKLKERIQGDWLCIGILDSNEQPVPGKFGNPNEYLKFSFVKSRLTITESPFDEGISMVLTFKNDNSFDWMPGAVYDIPERIYEVKELDDRYLALTTRTQTGEIITYHFLNQNNFTQDTSKEVIDNGVLIIQHLRFSKTQPNNINRVSEYQITNDSIFLTPRPIFRYPTGGSFGQIFSFNFRLPKDFKLDEVSEEMTIEFDVADDGASNFKITKGLRNEIDSEVIRVMEKLRKSWKPIVIDGRSVRKTLRFHLYFYMTFAELQLPWK